MILAIFDIDDTICNSWEWSSGRKSPREFFTPENIATLQPLEPVASICKEMLEQQGDQVQVVYLTGRGEASRRPTVKWLLDHGFMENSPPLFMCPESHYRNGGTTVGFKLSALRALLGQERELPELIVVYDDDTRNLATIQQYLQATRFHYEMFHVVRNEDSLNSEITVKPWGKYHPGERAKEIVQQPDLDIDAEDGAGEFMPPGVSYER